MNKTTIQRFKEAKKYQKLAIRAILPEQAAKHMDVIEKEVKEMFFECIAELTRPEKQGTTESDSNDKESGLKKVNID